MIIKDNNKDDVFEHLNDNNDDPFTYIQKYYSDLRKSSSAKQITIGAISGWSAGFVFAKFGKTAAAAIGGTWLLLHLAHYNGYIKIDWKRVNKDMALAQKEFNRRKDKELPHLMTQMQRFVKDNVVLATGFAGGFLLGLSSA